MSRIDATFTLIGCTFLGLLAAVGGLGSAIIGAALLWVRWSLTGVVGLMIGTLLCLLACYWFIVAYAEGWEPLRELENQPASVPNAKESAHNDAFSSE